MPARIGGVGPSRLALTEDDLLGDVALARGIPGRGSGAVRLRPVDAETRLLTAAEVSNNPRGGTGGVPVGGLGGRVDLFG